MRYAVFVVGKIIPIQFDAPNFRGGANSFSLNEARECFLEFSNNAEKQD